MGRRAEESRGEQRRAEESRGEQRRGEQTVNTPHATGRSTRLSPMEDDALAMRAKTPPPRGEDKAMKAKSPPRWGVGSGSSVATGAGQRGGGCPPLGTPAPVRSHPFGGQTNLPPME